MPKISRVANTVEYNSESLHFSVNLNKSALAAASLRSRDNYPRFFDEVIRHNDLTPQQVELLWKELIEKSRPTLMAISGAIGNAKSQVPVETNIIPFKGKSKFPTLEGANLADAVSETGFIDKLLLARLVKLKHSDIGDKLPRGR